MEYKTLVVVNPNSANGSTGKNIEKIKAKIKKNLGYFTLSMTEKVGHATEITNQGLKGGFNRIIVIGGDGSINEVINGFFENNQPINQKAVLGILSQGTGADFIKSINLPKDLDSALEKIKTNNFTEIDIGKVDYQSFENEGKSRYFINITDIGIGGEVVEKVNNTTKLFGGFVSFYLGTVSTVMTYQNKRTKIKFDDGFEINQFTNNVIVGNGQFFGGGMKVLPDAKLDDGEFDVLIIGDLSKVELLSLSSKIYQGTHIKHPKMFMKKTKSIIIDSEIPQKVDIDGECDGITPAKIEIIPKAIKIIL